MFFPRGQSFRLVDLEVVGLRRQKLGKKVSQAPDKSSPKQFPLVEWERMVSVKEKSALVLGSSWKAHSSAISSILRELVGIANCRFRVAKAIPTYLASTLFGFKKAHLLKWLGYF